MLLLARLGDHRLDHPLRFDGVLIYVHVFKV